MYNNTKKKWIKDVRSPGGPYIYIQSFSVNTP